MKLYYWLTFVSTDLYKAFSPWLRQKETAEATRQAAEGLIK